MTRHSRSRVFKLSAAVLLWLLPAAVWAAGKEDQEIRLPQNTEEAMRAETTEQLLAEIPEYRLQKPSRTTRAQQASKSVPVDYSCVPTCAENDSRLLAINATDLITYVKPAIDLRITVPAGASSFRVAVFDGDGGLQSGDRWDIGLPADYWYKLIADADGRGEGEVVLQAHSSQMLNADWCCSVVRDTEPSDAGDFIVPTSAAARTPSGEYIYTLRIEPDGFSCLSYSHFNGLKVRTDAALSVEPGNQPLALVSNLHSAADVQDIYPELDLGTLPDIDPGQLVTTSYDGTFSILFEVPAGEQELTVWDGDFDHGRFDLTEMDTDDPDTHGTASFEGLDEGCNSMQAEHASMPAPFDDLDSSGMDILRLRSPAVRYRLIFPDGREFSNDDPSGNAEWEKFTITTTEFFDRATADFQTSNIPAGIYELRVEGLDVQNLVAVKLPYRVVTRRPGGEGCTPGYWKQQQHHDSWSFFAPDDLFSDVFDVPEGDLTLLEALRSGGGGFNAFARHAVAALLNAAHLEVDYRYHESQIVGAVQQAYDTGEPEATKDLFAVENEQGCPLN